MDEARQEERLLIGHVETTIRASPEQIIGYQMYYDRKIKLSQLDPIVDVRYEIDPGSEEPGATCLCSTSSRPLRSTTAPSWLHSRQNVCAAPPTYIWVNVPIDRPDQVRPEQGALRPCAAQIGCRALRLTRNADGPTNRKRVLGRSEGPFPAANRQHVDITSK